MPKMQKLQENPCSNNKERYNIEVQKLYEKRKVNPHGRLSLGMLPLFPILLSPCTPLSVSP